MRDSKEILNDGALKDLLKLEVLLDIRDILDKIYREKKPVGRPKRVTT